MTEIALRTYSYLPDPFCNSRRNPSAEEIAEYAAKRDLMRDVDYLAENGIVAKSDNKIGHINFIKRLSHRADRYRVQLMQDILLDPWVKVIADNRTVEQRNHDAAVWLQTDRYRYLTKNPNPCLLKPSETWTEDDISNCLDAHKELAALAAEYLDKFANGFV